MLDLQEVASDVNGCEVCKMVLAGLKTYQDKIGDCSPLPTSISIQCVPGRFMVVKRGAQKPSPDSVLSGGKLQASPSLDDILGTDGLEFFKHTGNIQSSCIFHQSLIMKYARNFMHAQTHWNRSPS